MTERSTTTGDLLFSLSSFGIIACWLFVVGVVVGGMSLFRVELHAEQQAPRFSVTAVFVVTVALALAIHSAVARWHRGRASLVLAISVLGWFPPLVAIADYELGLVMFPGFVRETGGADRAVYANYLPWYVMFMMALCPLIVGCVTPLLARLVRSGRIARPAAIVVWLLSASLVVLGVARSRRLPDPDTYVSSLPVVATVTEGTHAFLGETEVLFTEGLSSCGRYDCCRLETVGEQHARTIVGPQLPCQKLQIARDDAAQLWIVGDDDAAVRMGSLEQVAVHPRTIHARLAPPIGWVIGGAAGMVLAILPIAFGFRRRRVDGQDATHLGGGRIQLPDGRTVDLPEAAKLLRGPVVVDVGVDRSDYRTAPPLPTRVLSEGTLEDRKRESEMRAAGATLTAVAIVAISCATLVGAAAHGIW